MSLSVAASAAAADPVAVLRTGRGWELVPAVLIPSPERDGIAGLADPACFGIVRQAHGGEQRRTVSREMALLLFTLQRPEGLPLAALGHRDGARDRAMIDLVAAGVLEVADADGSFSSGSAACARLFGDPVGDTTHTRANDLAHDAIRSAEALATDDAAEIADYLYRFNTRPLSPEWASRLPNPVAVAAYLALDDGDATSATLVRHWRSRTAAPDDHWIFWHARHARAAAGDDGAVHKLYVSASVEALPTAFAAAVDVLTALRAPQLKIGRDVRGLLRPDKLVAYFATLDDLLRAADALRTALRGTAAQGVPFTAEAGDGDALLSWAIDPPERAGEPRESWRRWIAGKLAGYLIAGRQGSRGSTEGESWRWALARLRLDGIDTSRWIASPSAWSASGALP
jgi:hypothetical protein